MKFNIALLAILIIIGIIMVILGAKANMKPPILTGIGFFIIALLFKDKISSD